MKIRLLSCVVLALVPCAAAQSDWTSVETQTFLPPAPVFWGNFGNSVAACGDLAFIGAPELDVFFPSEPGSAHLFERDGSSWSLVQTLLAADGALNDAFGTSVASSSTNSYLAVGAPRASSAGVAYLYFFSGGSHGELARLEPNDLSAGALFGISVDVEGTSVVVGAPFDQPAGVSSGSAYVFNQNLTAKLTPSDASGTQTFGWSVAAADGFGAKVIVGAPRPAAGIGSAYVYAGAPAGYLEQGRLQPSTGSAALDFGFAVDLAGDVAVVGAPHNDTQMPTAGSVFVYRFDGNIWAEEQELVAPTPVGADQFGFSVQVEGERILVGSPGPAGGAGRAHLYQRQAGTWVHVQEFAAGAGVAEDFFGTSVALEGDLVLAGALGVDDGPSQQSGAAYAFELGRSFATPFCFGDGSGTACPCANESAPGGRDGCLALGEGARLGAFGSNSVAADDLVLIGDFGRTTTVFLFAGGAALNGGNGLPFGGGLRCVGAPMRRLGVNFSNHCGQAIWGNQLISRGGFSAGDQVRFQAWLRAPGGGCGAGFGLSSALEVTLAP